MTAKPGKFQITPFDEADRDEVAGLHAKSWQVTYGAMVSARDLQTVLLPDIARRWAAYAPGPGDIVLVARETERLIGFSAAWMQPDPYLDNLHVAAEAQGRGIARALLGETALRLRQAGHDSLRLTVFTANQGARAVYAHLGGVEKEVAPYRLGGVSVPSVSVNWQSLTPLLPQAASSSDT